MARLRRPIPAASTGDVVASWLRMVSPGQAQAEAFRLQGQQFLDAQPVVGITTEVVPPQQQASHQRRLVQGELPTDAGTFAGTERFVRVRRPGLDLLRAEPVRVEGVR